MKYVGIITAMTEELDAVKKIMNEEKDYKTINGIEVVIGKIQSTPCVVTICGAGKVNAARITQLLIDKFDIDYIINVGVAGSLSYRLKIGDIVIGKKVVQHDFDITAFGHSKGYIPGVGNEVRSDRELVEKFQTAIDNIEKRIYNIELGTIATGDIFVTDVAMKDKIASKFRAICVEMEAGAIAQICKLGNVPFIIIRSISDTPNGDNAKDYDQYIKLAAKRSANILREFFIKEKELKENEIEELT